MGNCASNLNFGGHPRAIREGLWVFPPNQQANGSTSWWLDCDPEPLLIDCPSFSEETLKGLKKLARGRSALIILTNRDAHGQIREFQEELGWPVLLQEQEAYLLPSVSELKTFEDKVSTKSGINLLWTPGPSPGSCIALAQGPWNVIFCGRLLIPVGFNQLAGIKHPRTFHWPRHLQSLEKVRKWIPSDARPGLASGANLSLLGSRLIVDWEGWSMLKV